MAEPEFVTRDPYRQDLAAIAQQLALLRNDVSWFKWVLAIGFGVLLALRMAMLGALWQIMQRLPGVGH